MLTTSSDGSGRAPDVIRGRCDERFAELVVTDDQVEWRTTRGFVLPLAEERVFNVREIVEWEAVERWDYFPIFLALVCAFFGAVLFLGGLVPVAFMFFAGLVGFGFLSKSSCLLVLRFKVSDLVREMRVRREDHAVCWQVVESVSRRRLGPETHDTHP